MAQVPSAASRLSPPHPEKPPPSLNTQHPSYPRCFGWCLPPGAALPQKASSLGRTGWERWRQPACRGRACQVQAPQLSGQQLCIVCCLSISQEATGLRFRWLTAIVHSSFCGINESLGFFHQLTKTRGLLALMHGHVADGQTVVTMMLTLCVNHSEFFLSVIWTVPATALWQKMLFLCPSHR